MLTIFLREGRWVCRACATAKWQCMVSEGDTIKVSRKKTEDMEEGSSSRKKRKRKEDEEIEAEFSLMVEELWRRVVRKWEESEWCQEERWAAMMVTLGHIADDVQELLDGLVLEEKEKGKEKGVRTEKDRHGEMEVEEMLKEAEKDMMEE